MVLIDEGRAKELAQEIVNDSAASDYSKSYAQKLLESDMTEQSLKRQVQYILHNAPPEYEQKYSDLTEFYCEICGTRDVSNAHTGDTSAHMSICEGCYESMGEPSECSRCGEKTYQGDTIVSGENEGEFFCNSCLLKL